MTRRLWPWRVTAALVMAAGLWAIATFTFLMWFTLGMRAFEGDEPGTGHWVMLGAIDLAEYRRRGHAAARRAAGVVGAGR